MATVTIFRVETNDGLGPYTVRCGVGALHDGSPNHPAPGFDYFLDHTGETCDVWTEALGGVRSYNCCFDSWEQFNDWFGKDKSLEILARANFKLVVFKVESRYVYFGNRQCMFMRCKATVVKKIRI